MSKLGGTLWITRMGPDGNDHDVARIGYGGDGARDTFDHADRVMRRIGAKQGAEALATGDLLVTLLDDSDDLADSDPLRVPAAQADWFLDTWLKVPAGWRQEAP